MMWTANLSRREFFQASTAGTVALAGAVVASGDRPATAWAAPSAQDEVRLTSWELVELPGLTMRPDKEGRKWALRITATNGAVGVMPVRSCKGFSDATAQILKANNLLDHPRLFDVMTERQVPADQLKAADILCWDLHARMRNQPLHALLGTKRTKVLRYGDVRGRQPDFSPPKYEGPLPPVPCEQQIPQYAELLKAGDCTGPGCRTRIWRWPATSI